MFALKAKSLLLEITTAVLVCVSASSSQSDLSYQDRGNRFEGIKAIPVTGHDIELVSALIDYEEPTERFPESLHIRFHLRQPAKPYLVVREFYDHYHYWMDKVRPEKPWSVGFDNEFSWPTKDVIRKLRGIKDTHDLGVVARLDRETPALEESICPVAFYHSKLPRTIGAYIFAFKTNGAAHLTCRIYKGSNPKPVFTQNYPRVSGGQPFTIKWDVSSAEEYNYKLVITGYFRVNNDPIAKTIHFYHKKGSVNG